MMLRFKNVLLNPKWILSALGYFQISIEIKDTSKFIMFTLVHNNINWYLDHYLIVFQFQAEVGY